MVVTKHEVTSEYLSQVTGYIPLMWDIFLDTYRFKIQEGNIQKAIFDDIRDHWDPNFL